MEFNYIDFAKDIILFAYDDIDEEFPFGLILCFIKVVILTVLFSIIGVASVYLFLTIAFLICCITIVPIILIATMWDGFWDDLKYTYTWFWIFGLGLALVLSVILFFPIWCVSPLIVAGISLVVAAVVGGGLLIVIGAISAAALAVAVGCICLVGGAGLALVGAASAGALAIAFGCIFFAGGCICLALAVVASIIASPFYLLYLCIQNCYECSEKGGEGGECIGACNLCCGASKTVISPTMSVLPPINKNTIIFENSYEISEECN